ncbi:MAG: alpha/beta hydrolase [Ruminococcus sp.]|nr:alpha/beta hydrolase [Ruminococcus sp.]
MIFNLFGNSNNPVVIMLAGSFCPAESMELVYKELEKDYYVIAPTYNGCHENSKDFTSRRGETAEICTYIKERKIATVKMIYGQSMGCEIGLELAYQLIENGIVVENGFFDGAPCASLPKPMRRVMLSVFRNCLNAFRGKSLDETMNIRLVKIMSNKNPEALKPMIEPILIIAPYLTDKSVKNQVECCYTFDFPQFASSVEKNFHFFYGGSEKAYRLCYKGTRKSYPNADYIIKKGYGHCTYMTKNTEDYIKLLYETMKPCSKA